ncbi:condensation domain protein [Mycobacterium xenopi 4042]|uniref:Condensation domain protein n=1 Tax=Mycobacterium xenopi 4042 TaxID=1299334 RepID=X7YN16_MYCXE|nr:condensation domain protein [Mycobacterium xenopi 4042]
MLVVVVHHIAADGWSITPLVRDLGLALGARCAGRVPDWDPLPVQYADYTLWQRAQFGDLDDSQSLIAAQLAYWEQVLAGCPSGWCCPPIGRIRRWPVSGWSGGRGVAARLQQQVARVAREHNATGSWWCRLRWRCCWQACREFGCGCWVSDRWAADPALDELVGFSSIRWCCGWIWPVIPVWLSCCPGAGAQPGCFRASGVPFEVLVERLNPPGRWLITRWCR